MKIGKYIIIFINYKGNNIKLEIPYSNNISYQTDIISYGKDRKNKYIKNIKNPKEKIPIINKFPVDYLENKGFFKDIKRTFFISCKYIKPNTGIRYKIIGKYWKLLIIKQIN